MRHPFRGIIEKLDVHTSEILRKGFSSLFIRVLGVLCSLATSIILGRLLGAEGLGSINIINQLITVLMVFTMLGMENILIRQIAIGHNRDRSELIGESIHTAKFVNTTAAIILGLIGALAAKGLSSGIFNLPALEIAFVIAFLSVIPDTLGRVYIAGINGFRKVWQSIFYREGIVPLTVILSLVICWAWGIEVTVFLVVTFYAAGKCIKLMLAGIHWRLLFPSRVKYQFRKELIKQAMPLLFVSAMAIIATSVDVIMLGSLSGSEAAGIYTVGSRIALFLVFFLQVSNAAISPKLAALYEEGSMEAMSLMVKRVTLGLILVGAIFMMVFVFLGRPVLGLWGHEFYAAYPVLIILGIGQFINISTGCSGLLLIMCGYEKVHSYISGVSLTLNVVLNLVLIQKFGPVGAAIATSFTMICENLAKMYFAKKHVGILTWPGLDIARSLYKRK